MSISIKGHDREFEIRFDRRRYGSRGFYTWAMVLHKGDWLTLGDPWPCSNPKRSEVLAAAIYYTRIADLRATGLSATEASSIAGAEITKEVQQHTPRQQICEPKIQHRMVALTGAAILGEF